MMTVKVVSKHDRLNQEIFMVKGALEIVLPNCTKYMYGGQIVPLQKQHEKDFITEAHEIAAKGLRVLALAKGYAPNDLIFLGIVGITDPPRPLVRESIDILRQSGVLVKMVTGDSRDTAVAIGM